VVKDAHLVPEETVVAWTKLTPLKAAAEALRWAAARMERDAEVADDEYKGSYMSAASDLLQAAEDLYPADGE